MFTELRNKDMWERAFLSKWCDGSVTADFTDDSGNPTRRKGFMSVSETRDWFRSDGCWMVTRKA